MVDSTRREFRKSANGWNRARRRIVWLALALGFTLCMATVVICVNVLRSRMAQRARPMPPSAMPMRRAATSTPAPTIQIQMQPGAQPIFGSTSIDPNVIVPPMPSKPSPQFEVRIDPNTPVKDLLPTPPKYSRSNRPVLVENLAQVPEVQFQAPIAKSVARQEAVLQTAHTIARINHLNGKKTDGFVEALRAQRPDMAELPFAMGDACRTTGARSKQFALAVATVRRALAPHTQAGQPAAPAGTHAVVVQSAENPIRGNGFWERYQSGCAQEDKNRSGVDRSLQEHVMLARVAALMQMLATESIDLRLGLVKYLAGVTHAEATRCLARLAIFTDDDAVRQSALEALKVRRDRDYTEVLVQGLRYPWPAVARRAAEAAVKLERTDLVPQLVGMLREPDPRTPMVREVEGKQVAVVSELVRVNHNRNCLLCHAPGNTGSVPPGALTSPIPIPGTLLSSPSQGYQSSSPDVLVRVDVTYLRQDFSVLQPVADAHPWPEMQRFDFLVRTRTLPDDEATAYREKLAVREPGRLSPYARVTLAALRELTGRDTDPTAEAWQRLLHLPGTPGRAAAVE